MSSNKKDSWSNADKISLASTIATFIALIFSFCQNSTSNQRYEQNERDSREELKRVRDKDSIQTKVFINELKEQQKKNTKDREKDSLQLALLSRQLGLLNKSTIAQTRGIGIQNQSLQVQILANKSDLVCTVTFDLKQNNDTSVVVSPVFTVDNNGNAPAQNLSIKYLIATRFLEKKAVKCERGLNNTVLTIYKPLNPGKTTVERISYKNGSSLPFISSKVINHEYYKTSNNLEVLKWLAESRVPAGKQQDKITTEYNKKLNDLYIAYNRKRFLYYLISQINYFDKYENKENTICTINQIPLADTLSYPINATNVRADYASPLEVYALKDCIKGNKLNYKKILKYSEDRTPELRGY